MASGWFNKGVGSVMNGTIDLDTTTLKVMLVDSDYVFDKDHDFASDITDELSAASYVGGFGGSGRKTLASKTVTIDNTNDLAYLDADDVTWTALNAGTIGGAIILKEDTNDAASPLLLFIDFTNLTTSGANVMIQWAATGIAKITPA